MLKIIFVFFIGVVVTECTRDTYEYISTVESYIKLHRFPRNFQEARQECYLEGGILASPFDKEISTALIKIMHVNDIEKIYTGIHATYSKGDYTTVSGTPLSALDVGWLEGAPANEDCVIMNPSGRLVDVKCTSKYPFMCDKSPEKMQAHSCSSDHEHNSQSDYTLFNETQSCYKFHKEGRTWPAAFKACNAEDAYLAIINSEEESRIMKELFAQNPPHTIPGDFHKDAASIGFTKSGDNQEWFTIHGQSLVEAGFASFNAGEPNNIGNNETCGSVWRTGLFNDHNCDILLPFICEKPITPYIDIRLNENGN